MTNTTPNTPASPVLNVEDAEPHVAISGEHWGGEYRVLTPFMTEQGGALGVCINRMPPGRPDSPLHCHIREDEAFYLIS
ncbi:MAG: hypothetical protein ACJA1R_002980 [Flavobacteriales bacterium]|jgi:hypothetical protein